MTAAPDVDAEFRAALQHDADVSPPDMPPPPRREPAADPDAPHGRLEDGTPATPYGTNKKTGKPNLKPAGPGRGKKTEQPRVTKETPAKAAKGAAKDYTADLAGFGQTLWMGGCALPPLRPYAHLLKESLPGMVGAWNVAAQQNPAVRGYVEKLSGDSSWAWVIGVTVTTAPFLMSCWELARPVKDPAKRAERDGAKKALGEQAAGEFREYIGTQIAQMQAGQEAA